MIFNKWNTLFILLLILSCNCYVKAEELSEKKEKSKTELHLVDKKATPETKALYANLWEVRNRGCMFGHHEGLLYGRNWKNDANRSDVKDVCGDFPAVLSLDFAKIEYNQENSINGPLFSDVRRVTKEAYARGEVITYCWHADNPLTGNNAWDNSDNTVVKEILIEGSAMNLKFKTWLDNIAAFNSTLKDENGIHIPIIFRPFHEHTQAWNWWGKKCATEEEFIGLWKFTIKYLRDVKQVHNFIYAISPQMDFVQVKEDLLYRWPGDDFVDFMGMDCYHGNNTEAFVNNLANLASLSKEKMKPFGVTETGVEGILKEGKPYKDYWTKEMMTPLTGSGASLVIMWRNMYDPSGSGHHFYAPFEGHPSSDNFNEFYKSAATIFSNDLPDMYKMPEGFVVK